MQREKEIINYINKFVKNKLYIFYVNIIGFMYF